MLKEMSDLTRNMDGLFRELKESNANLKKIGESVGDVAEDISKKDGDQKDKTEDIFRGFTESIIKSLDNNNNDIVSTLSKSLNDSVNQFAKSIPGQIASVKSNVPIDYASLIGGNGIKNMVSGIASKIPGLKTGGESSKSGLAVVGEEGPELVSLNVGDQVVSNEKLESVVSGGNPSLDALTQQISDSEKARNERQASIEEAILQGSNTERERESQIPLAKQATKLITDESLRSQFLDYARTELDRKDRDELSSDEDYFMSEFDYWKSSKDDAYFTEEEIANIRQGKSLNSAQDNMYDPKGGKEDTMGDLITDDTKIRSEENSPDDLSDRGSEIMKERRKLSAMFKRKPKKKKNSNDVIENLMNPSNEMESSVSQLNESQNSTNTGNESVSSSPELKKPEVAGGSELEKSQNELKVSDVESLTARLRAKLEAKQGEMDSSKKSADSLPAESSSSGSTTTGSSSGSGNSKGGSSSSEQQGIKQIIDSMNSPQSSKELGDIRALLVSILGVLKGPLSATRDQPYRPHSNQF